MFSSSEDEYFRTARKGYMDNKTKLKLEPFRFRCKKIIDENFDSSEYESGSEETSNGSEERKTVEDKNKKSKKNEIGNIDEFETSSSNEGVEKAEKADEDKHTAEEEERLKFDDESQDDLKWLATFVQNQAASDFWKPPNETPRNPEIEEDTSELPTKDNTENIQDKEEDKKETEKTDETKNEESTDHKQVDQESSSDEESDLSSYVDRLKKLQDELLTVKKELAEAKKLAIEEKQRLIEEEEKRKKEKEQILNEGVIDVISACRKCSNSNIAEWATPEICRPMTVPSLTSYDFGTLHPREDPSANYRATLDTLEKLMNDELSNIKDNMGKLEPLKKTALDWETEADRPDKKSLVYRHDYTVKVISSQMQAETEVKQ